MKKGQPQNAGSDSTDRISIVQYCTVLMLSEERGISIEDLDTYCCCVHGVLSSELPVKAYSDLIRTLRSETPGIPVEIISRTR